MRQWQMLGWVGTEYSAYRTAPHWQPPVRAGVRSSSGIVVSPCHFRGSRLRRAPE
jgi:hypothetical protein